MELVKFGEPVSKDQVMATGQTIEEGDFDPRGDLSENACLDDGGPAMELLKEQASARQAEAQLAGMVARIRKVASGSAVAAVRASAAEAEAKKKSLAGRPSSSPLVRPGSAVLGNRPSRRIQSAGGNVVARKQSAGRHRPLSSSAAGKKREGLVKPCDPSAEADLLLMKLRSEFSQNWPPLSEAARGHRPKSAAGKNGITLKALAPADEGAGGELVVAQDLMPAQLTDAMVLAEQQHEAEWLALEAQAMAA